MGGKNVGKNFHLKKLVNNYLHILNHSNLELKFNWQRIKLILENKINDWSGQVYILLADHFTSPCYTGTTSLIVMCCNVTNFNLFTLIYKFPNCVVIQITMAIWLIIKHAIYKICCKELGNVLALQLFPLQTVLCWWW